MAYYSPPNSLDIQFQFNDVDKGYSPPNSRNINFNATQEITPEPTENILRILGGTSTTFTSVWADPTANIQNANVYVGSTGIGAAFSVINMASQALVDFYSYEIPGRGNETLFDNDIVDINVGG